MSTTNTILVALAGAAVGGLLATLGLRTSGVGPVAAPPPQRSSSPATESTFFPSAATAADLGPVLSRLDALAADVDALRRELADARRAPERVPVAGQPAGVLDVDALADAMAVLEQRKLDALTDEELLQSAWQVQKQGNGTAEALRRMQLLLDRPLDPERRAEVMIQLGMMQRNAKLPEELAASARTLQQVVDAHGVDSALGLRATSQLIWTATSQGHPEVALAHAEAVLRSAAATPDQRRDGRWARAIVLARLGDTASARGEFEQLLRELGSAPEHQKLAEDIRRRLGEL